MSYSILAQVFIRYGLERLIGIHLADSNNGPLFIDLPANMVRSYPLIYIWLKMFWVFVVEASFFSLSLSDECKQEDKCKRISSISVLTSQPWRAEFREFLKHDLMLDLCGVAGRFIFYGLGRGGV